MSETVEAPRALLLQVSHWGPCIPRYGCESTGKPSSGWSQPLNVQGLGDWTGRWQSQRPQLKEALGARNQLLSDLVAKNSELWVLILEAHYPGL